MDDKILNEYIADANASMAAETAKTLATAKASAQAQSARPQEDPTTQLNSLVAEQRAGVTPANQRYGVNAGAFGSLGGVDGYGS